MSWSGGRSRELAASLPVAGNFVDDETDDLSEPTEEAWRDLVNGVVERIWIEPDGSVTIEGPLTATEEERVQQPDQSEGTSASPPRRSAVL